MSAASLSLGDLDWEASQDEGPGTGAGVRWKLLFPGKRTPRAEMSMGVGEIAPGGKLPLHRHAPAEIYHVTHGEGIVRAEGVAHELRPGVAACIPPMAWHETMPMGDQPLRFLFVFAADALEDIRCEFAEDG